MFPPNVDGGVHATECHVHSYMLRLSSYRGQCELLALPFGNAGSQYERTVRQSSVSSLERVSTLLFGRIESLL
jgi:hypothetical protein